MFHPRHLFFTAGSLGLTAFLLIGCAGEQPAPPLDGNGEPQANRAELDPEIEEALSALPPADREAALEQEVCPVTGEPLGSMGTPEKINVEGREVFICCEGCVTTLRENPEEYFAKLTAE